MKAIILAARHGGTTILSDSHKAHFSYGGLGR